MKLFIFFCVFLSILKGSFAQEIVCSLKDKEAFEGRVVMIDTVQNTNFGRMMVSIGKTFLGTPYVDKTLEIREKESLVVNLHGLDCTTFVENVLVFSLMRKSNEKDFGFYTDLLKKIRYKDGKIDGYASRLHYFSEWISNNEEKGLLKNITNGLIGSENVIKKINFMSRHRELYPFLKDDINYGKIQQSENELNLKGICFLPQNQIQANEHLIQSGDIIALNTAIKGLDVTHTGIITKEKDGHIHLLHASSSSGRVEISKLPLIDYLKKIKNNTGIMVIRTNVDISDFLKN